MKTALILLISIITLNLAPAIALTDDPLPAVSSDSSSSTTTDEGGIKVYLEVPLGSEGLVQVKTVCTPVCITRKDKDSDDLQGVAIGTNCKEYYPPYEIGGDTCVETDPNTAKPKELNALHLQSDISETTNACDTDPIKKLVEKDPKILYETVSCRNVQELKADSGIGLFETYVGLIYRWAASIVGIVAVVVMIISGIQIAVAGGDTGKIDEAKKRIYQSLAGVVVLFLSALILYTINPNFFTAG